MKHQPMQELHAMVFWIVLPCSVAEGCKQFGGP